MRGARSTIGAARSRPQRHDDHDRRYLSQLRRRHSDRGRISRRRAARAGDCNRDHRARSAAGSRRLPGAVAFRLQQALRVRAQRAVEPGDGGGRRVRLFRSAYHAKLDTVAAGARRREHDLCCSRGSDPRPASPSGNPGHIAAGCIDQHWYCHHLGRRRAAALTAMNSPHASAQALYEKLSLAGRKFVEDVLGSLSAGQRLESAEIFKALTAGLTQDSGRLAEIQKRYYQRHLELWMDMARGNDTTAHKPVAVPDQGDRRFRAPEWQQLPFFDYLKQTYLINSRWLAEFVEAAQLDDRAKNKLRFFAHQLIDAAAPANYPATNPEVLKLATETNGESLRRGFAQLSAD